MAKKITRLQLNGGCYTQPGKRAKDRGHIANRLRRVKVTMPVFNTGKEFSGDNRNVTHSKKA